ncbi:MAG: D-alanyl-D-alanine carboxypeptidase [Gemmatimonadales bacterium]
MFMPASNTKLIVTSAATVLLGPGPSDGIRHRHHPGRHPRGRSGPLRPGRPGTATASRPTRSRRAPVSPTPSPSSGRWPAPSGPAARRRIAGAVVGDGSWFEPLAVHPTWENDDLVWGYAAPVTGLGFNENLVEVVVEPTMPSAPARVAIEPDLGGLAVVNRVVTVGPEGRTDVTRRREEGSVAESHHPRRRAARSVGLAVPDPNRFAALALRRVLADSGIDVLGGVGHRRFDGLCRRRFRRWQ